MKINLSLILPCISISFSLTLAHPLSESLSLSLSLSLSSPYISLYLHLYLFTYLYFCSSSSLPLFTFSSSPFSLDPANSLILSLAPSPSLFLSLSLIDCLPHLASPSLFSLSITLPFSQITISVPFLISHSPPTPFPLNKRSGYRMSYGTVYG